MYSPALFSISPNELLMLDVVTATLTDRVAIAYANDYDPMLEEIPRAFSQLSHTTIDPNESHYTVATTLSLPSQDDLSDDQASKQMRGQKQTNNIFIIRVYFRVPTVIVSHTTDLTLNPYHYGVVIVLKKCLNLILNMKKVYLQIAMMILQDNTAHGDYQIGQVMD
jgi:hypothetical protein